MKNNPIVSFFSLLTIFFSVGAFMSCSNYQYVQVYEVQSENCSKDKDVLVYNNDDCSITYNFWSERGNGGFTFHNKTDKNIYLMTSLSSFIQNGMAIDYDDMLMVKTKMPDANLYARSICIPPKSGKVVAGFPIYSTVKMQCGDNDSNFPKKSSAKINYTRDNTPMSFSNRIAYCLDNNLSDIKYVENIFWISSLQNYSEYSLIEKVKEIDCETSVMVYAKKNKMEAPYRFYNNYSMDMYSLDSKYEPFDQVGIFSVKKNRKK